MPIKQIQTRLAQIGVIRLGEKRRSASGKEYPAKLETFRVTSPSKPLIESVAALLGGEVRPWQSKTGPEWEVVTDATEIPVHVPPQVIDPNYELWGNGFRARFCDGETERIRGAACLCEAAARVRYERAGMRWPDDGMFERDPKNDCKPTTRLTLMISDIPAGVGTFKLESHGMNAAAELPALSKSIAAAREPIPATLRLQQREGGVMKIVDGREKVEARKYAVPVLDFFGLFTPRQAFSGQLESAIQNAIGGGQQAIEAPKLTAGDVLDQAEELETVEDLQELWRRAAAAQVLTNDVKKALQERVDALNATKAEPSRKPARTQETPPVEPTPIAAQQPAGRVVDAEVEPDRDEVWGAIVREAHKAGWNLPTLQAKYQERMGHDSNDEQQATGWRYQEFLEALKKGEMPA